MKPEPRLYFFKVCCLLYSTVKSVDVGSFSLNMYGKIYRFVYLHQNLFYSIGSKTFAESSERTSMYVCTFLHSRLT
jgi:hypothetical protein